MIEACRLSDRSWDALLAIRDGEPPPAGGFDDPLAALYLPLALRSGTPMVIAQVGQSLDGRVATVDGDARDLSSADGLAHLHRIRALVDAVVVGAGCVVADNPRLTVRNVTGRNPVRVAIDPNGCMPPDCNLLAPQGQTGARTILVQADDQPIRRGIETISLPRNSNGNLDPADILNALHARGLMTILIEGGATTIEYFIARKMVDRLHICIAPIIIGSGLPGLKLPHVSLLSQALRPRVISYDLGQDVMFDCELLERRREPAISSPPRAREAASTQASFAPAK